MGRPPSGSLAVTRTPALVLVLAGLAVVGALAAGVLTGFAPLLDLDGVVSEALYAGDSRATALDGLLEVLTAPGLTVFRLLAFLPVLVWLLQCRAWTTAAWVLTAIALIGPVTALLKHSVGRVRPDFDEGGAGYVSLSYPSGHSSGIATLVTVALLLAWPRLTGPARRAAAAAGVALVLVVGLTRIWLGVHYLSDVVGGWALGLSWSLGVALLFGGLPGGPAAAPAREEAAAPRTTS